MLRCRVITAHQPPDYPAVDWHQGQKLTVGRRDAEWPQFLWCTDPEGRAGWVPDSFLSLHAEIATLNRDYTTVELSTVAGESLEILESVAMWHWCRNVKGELGWIPACCVEIVAAGD